MEEDDMVKSRVGNTLVQRRTEARGAYKGVPSPSRRLLYKGVTSKASDPPLLVR